MMCRRRGQRRAQVITEPAPPPWPDPKKFAKGPFASGEVGTLVFSARAGKYAEPGVAFGVRLGYDLFRWLDVQAHVLGAELRRLDAAAAVRSVVPDLPLRRRGASQAADPPLPALRRGRRGAGAGLDQRARAGRRHPRQRTSRFAVVAGGGLDYHTLNRHFSVGLGADYLWLADLHRRPRARARPSTCATRAERASVVKARGSPAPATASARSSPGRFRRGSCRPPWRDRALRRRARPGRSGSVDARLGPAGDAERRVSAMLAPARRDRAWRSPRGCARRPRARRPARCAARGTPAPRRRSAPPGRRRAAGRRAIAATSRSARSPARCPMGVVEPLEVVEVEHHQRERGAEAARALDLLGDAQVEVAPQ